MMRGMAIAVVLTLVLGSSSAMAIDLRNEDRSTHDIRVKSKAMTKKVTVPGRSMSIIICVGKCTFSAPGLGTVRAAGNDTVAIRGGKLVVREAPVVALPNKPTKKRWRRGGR